MVMREWLQDRRHWDVAFGPQPDQQGTLCPVGILEEFGLPRVDEASEQGKRNAQGR